ncbi:MAG TPA: dienelactone hydrolase family protein [Steroidobacteraceae bacterium]|nr:dienelactone hydrolase family protein [Steroidobacteraceae bacterium]
MKALETVTVETGPQPVYTIIWMHGLGADGHDFEPLVPELAGHGLPALRFVFPHAPVRPVTINNGYPMRAWYDIVGIDRRSAEDFTGIGEAADSIGGLVHREHARGIGSDHIVLAGFSQGGAMALHLATRHPDTFAGIIALSTYLPLAKELAKSRNTANLATPIFMAHGMQDPVVPYDLAEESRQLLVNAGFHVDWHSYPMPHALCEAEVADLRRWLGRVCLARAA